MAVEKFNPKRVALHIVERNILVPEPKEYACPVFGDGYWTCPPDCFNLKDNQDCLVEDKALKCSILKSGQYEHFELLKLGVTIRQPFEGERFDPIPKK
jgi:hypothetical protein